MPRQPDDDESDDRRPTKGRPAEPAESGPWKALGITLGCVAVAFAGIMAYALSVAPPTGGPVAGDPPGDTSPLKPPGKPKTDADGTPQPDDWTPTKLPRTPSAMTARPSFYVQADATRQPLTVGWVREGVYLQGATLLAAVTSENKFVGYHTAGRATVAGPPDLKAEDGLGNVSATPDETAVFAKGRDQVFRLLPNARQWSSAPLGGYGSCLAVAMDRFLMVESRISDTQFRLYRWPPGGGVTLSAKWEVAGGVAAAAYDASAGVLWVARAKDWNATTGDLDRFALTGRGGTLLGTANLPFKVGITSRPVLSPDGRRAYVEDRAVEGDRLLPVEFPGRVVAAVGDFALLSNGEFADATGKVVGKAWDKVSLSAFAFSADQTGCWAYDFTAKTYRWYSVMLGGKLPTGTPTVDPMPPVVPTDPPPASIKATRLAALPGSDKQLQVLRYSDKHGLLAYAEVLGVTVLDTKTGTALPLPKLEGKARLRSADITPDQTALFASDGQNLHRLDLATRKWESKPFVGQRLIAIDGTTVLAQTRTGAAGTSYSLARWAQADVTVLSQLDWVTLFELGYDAKQKTLYALHWKRVGEQVVEKYTLGEKEFRSAGARPFAGTQTPRITYRPLSTDGKFFVQNTRGAVTGDEKAAPITYPEALVGVGREVGVSATGKLYHLATGQPAGAIPLTADAVAFDADGETVWVYGRASQRFTHFRLDAKK